MLKSVISSGKKQNFQGLASEDAQQILAAFRTLTFAFTPTSELLKDAYKLAVTYQRTVYDMLYVALSVDKQCSFVTADERLVNAIQSAFPNVVWVKNWSSLTTDF
jgi:predicted nucleic acid-binding protein